MILLQYSETQPQVIWLPVVFYAPQLIGTSIMLCQFPKRGTISVIAVSLVAQLAAQTLLCFLARKVILAGAVAACFGVS